MFPDLANIFREKQTEESNSRPDVSLSIFFNNT